MAAAAAASCTSLSAVQIVDYILADIPIFCVGIMSLGVFTFFIFMKRVDSLLFCLHMSVIIAFVSSILDLVQLLVGGASNCSTSTISGLITVREVGYALSFGLRLLFFWGFVAQPPPGEARQPGNAIHNGSWSRWGVLGLVLEVLTLGLVLVDPVLQILYRLITSLHKIGPLYELESTMQIVLSVVFILKLLLNCWVKMLVCQSTVPIRKALVGYLSVITALVISGLIGIVNITMFEFTETIAGRFLQAVEFYVLIVFMLTYSFYHLRRRSWGWGDGAKAKQQPIPAVRRLGSFRGLPSLKMEIGRPVMSSPELLRVMRRNVDESPPPPSILQRVSAASRMSSWIDIRRLSERVIPRPAVPSADLEKARLWYHDKAGPGNAEIDVSVRDSAVELDTPYSANQTQQNVPWQDPVYTSVLPRGAAGGSVRSLSPSTVLNYHSDCPESRAALDARRSPVLSSVRSPEIPPITIPAPTHARTATIEQQSPNSGDEVTFIYEDASRSVICSPLSGIDEIIQDYDGGTLRPPAQGERNSAQSSRISDLIRQQEELDKSIAALRLFSPTSELERSDDDGSISFMEMSPGGTTMRLPLLARSGSDDTRNTRSTQSDLSLSNFPDPPRTGVEDAFDTAPPVPPLRENSAGRSGILGLGRPVSAVWVCQDPEAGAVQTSSLITDSRIILSITPDDSDGEPSREHSRNVSSTLDGEGATLVSNSRNRIDSGGTQYEITSFIGRLTQEPGSFASSSALTASDDDQFVPPFVRTHGPSSSYGSARSLRPLFLPAREAARRDSLARPTRDAMHQESRSPEDRASLTGAQRRAFAAPDSRFSKPVGLPPRPRLASGGTRDLLTSVEESPNPP